MRTTLFIVGLLVALGGASRAAASDSHLVNLSARAQVETGSSVVIAGFVVAEESEEVLVRAVGPGLAIFDVPGLLADPLLTVFDADGNPIASNNDWNAADAAVFTQVGAFGLAGGSKDAALVIALPPGVYTAVVSGADGGTGVALAEVYDVTPGAGSRLVNLSARAFVDAGANILIPGLTISPGGGTRRMLIRVAGPALEGLGVDDFLADPQLNLVSEGGTVIAFNDNWGSDEPHVLMPAFLSAAAFDFGATNTKDAAIVRDLTSGLYTIQAVGVAGMTGVSLVEVYDLTPSGPPAVVTIAASDAVADESGTNPAVFTLTRTGNTSNFLIVNYTASGTAFNLLDYGFLNGRVAFAAGQDTATITLDPVPDLETETTETVTLTLANGMAYDVAAENSASATIGNVAGTLYVATLRPESGAAASTGYGTATILLNAAQTLASVSVSVSNLSSEQTTAYLRLGAPGETGAYLQGLPLGQASGVLWKIEPTGTYSAEDLVRALQNGLIYVGIESVNYPSGELRGHFLQGAGSQTFEPPPAPPAAPSVPANANDAARFLLQASFGPTQATIDDLLTKTYAQWIDAQMAAPASLHRAATLSDFAAHPEDGQQAGTRPGTRNRQTAWWGIALTAPDQLRQRVAFALSELLVVSDVNATIFNNQEGAAHYYDILVRNAFGNYRTLIDEVSRSPIMGIYLSHLRNAKADLVTGAQPDENYAREIMQLFSIGLVELQPDGTLKLDAAGLPIATYHQTTITEVAKVFTGWSFFNTNPTDNLFRRGPADWINPMSLYPGFHENGPKTIVGGVQLPANQGGARDLADTLDVLFNHPNTGPFVARRLIQRLVTSNPSPAYVYRVAQVFANNGAGVRGDLGAVVRAVLLDYEARASEVAANDGAGSLREPLLRLAAMLRALNATNVESRFEIANTTASLGQSPLQSPTVFNFFEPDYVMPGALAAAGLYAPEFQILTDSTAISVPNELRRYIYGAPSGIAINLTELLALVATPDVLLDRLNLLLCGGTMTTATRDRILLALTQLPTATNNTERVRTAIYLTVNGPDGATLR